MHPILRDRVHLLLYLIGWVPVGILLAASLSRDAGWTSGILLFVPLVVGYGFVGLSTWYVCRAVPIGATSFWRALLALSIGAATTSAAWVAIGRVWADVVESTTGWPDQRSLMIERSAVLFGIGVLLFWLAAAVSYLVIAFEESRTRETRAMEMALLAREAELKTLRAQIDPHFLYNSLHSISALTTSDPAAARRMCVLLADFLRSTVRLGATDRISLTQEIELVERFLAIERVRLGSRLAVEFDTSPASLGCLVPALMLQPLVENAVVHGIGQLLEGGTISIAAHRDARTLVIVLENGRDPDRPSRSGTGLGLDLLRRRMAAHYGDEGRVSVREEPSTFRIELRLPARETA